MKPKYLLIEFVFLFLLATTIRAGQSLDSIKLFIQEAKFEKVIEIANRLINSKKENSEIYYFDGISKKNLYKFKSAIESFQKSFQLDTSNWQNIVEIANCYKLIDESSKALVYYEKASAKYPENWTILTEVGNMNFALENYIEANNIFKKLYASDTANMYFVKKIAKSFDDLEQVDSAIYYYKKSIQLGTMDYATVLRLCNIYIKKKNYDEGLSLTRKFMQTDSLNPRINSINAYLLLLKKDYLNAYDKFLKCYRNNDSSLFVLKYLGISSFKIDSLEDAKIYLEKAYYLDTTDAQVTNFLGVACATYAYKLLGIYYLNKTIKLLTPDSVSLASVYFNLGKAYDSYSNSPCKNGYDAYLRASTLNPKDTLITYFLAYKYDGCLHDKSMAIKCYKQFISTRPARNKDGKNSPYRISYYDSAIRRLEELEKK
jgi:tetratricopeptide (TPR) repeat protein